MFLKNQQYSLNCICTIYVYTIVFFIRTFQLLSQDQAPKFKSEPDIKTTTKKLRKKVQTENEQSIVKNFRHFLFCNS